VESSNAAWLDKRGSNSAWLDKRGSNAAWLDKEDQSQHTNRGRPTPCRRRSACTYTIVRPTTAHNTPQRQSTLLLPTVGACAQNGARQAEWLVTRYYKAQHTPRTSFRTRTANKRNKGTTALPEY
jgi:hypothetical protein